MEPKEECSPVLFQAKHRFFTVSIQSMNSGQRTVCCHGSVQFSHSVVSDSATPWTAACQASLSITNSWSLLKLIFIGSVMPPSHLILCHRLFSCLQSFPASRAFPMSQFFASGAQSIGASASASVLPMNIQN